MDWGIPASDIGLIHLLYDSLRDLPVWYYLCTHSLSEPFGSGFGERYRYVQKVYERPFATDCSPRYDELV